MNSSKFNFSEEKLIKKHIELFNKNLVPKDCKGNYIIYSLGDDITSLSYEIKNEDLLNELLDSLIQNNNFKGNLIINSDLFNDIVIFFKKI